MVENIILPARGSSDTSSFKTIQGLVLPFICVLLGTRCGVGRLSCLSSCHWGGNLCFTKRPLSLLARITSMEDRVSVCASALASGPKFHTYCTFLTPSRSPLGPSPLRTLQPLWGLRNSRLEIDTFWFYGACNLHNLKGLFGGKKTYQSRNKCEISLKMRREIITNCSLVKADIPSS